MLNILSYWIASITNTLKVVLNKKKKFLQWSNAQYLEQD